MNETVLTVRGRAAAQPKLRTSKNNVPWIQFRLGASRRYFDRGSQTWKDDGTDWFTVRAFGSLATNASISIHRGDPVIVHGRFTTSQWTPEGEETPRTTLELVANAIGHDLRLTQTASLYRMENEPKNGYQKTDSENTDSREEKPKQRHDEEYQDVDHSDPGEPTQSSHEGAAPTVGATT